MRTSQDEDEKFDGVVMTFAEAVKKDIPAGYSFQFIPSLISRCYNSEQELSRTLTENEFSKLKDSCGGLIVPVEVLHDVAVHRGYLDILDYSQYLAHGEESDVSSQ